MNKLDFIHRFVPASAGSTARTLLLLHGTGGNENDMIPLGRDLDPTAALLSPRGNVLENGMPRFFRRLAEGVFDEEDVIRRAQELADFVGVAAARYEFDSKRVTAVGYSNGANIAAAILLLVVDLFSVSRTRTRTKLDLFATHSDFQGLVARDWEIGQAGSLRCPSTKTKNLAQPGAVDIIPTRSSLRFEATAGRRDAGVAQW